MPWDEIAFDDDVLAETRSRDRLNKCYRAAAYRRNCQSWLAATTQCRPRPWPAFLLYPVYTTQPVVQPVVWIQHTWFMQPIIRPVGCIMQTSHDHDPAHSSQSTARAFEVMKSYDRQITRNTASVESYVSGTEENIRVAGWTDMLFVIVAPIPCRQVCDVLWRNYQGVEIWIFKKIFHCSSSRLFSRFDNRLYRVNGVLRYRSAYC